MTPSPSSPSSSPTCPLAYPDKYEQAHAFVDGHGHVFSQEAHLVLKALESQVDKGECQEPKPNPWNEGRALWEAWSHLGKMAKEDAMRLYVKQIELDQPNWWRQQTATQSQAKGLASATPEAEVTEKKLDDNWTLLTAKGPKARYEHCSACIGEDVYVIGGRSSGRYLKDAWKFNLKTKTWTELAWHVEDTSLSVAIPPCAAACAVQTGKKILLVGGHLKPDFRKEKMDIYSINTSDMKSSILQTFGEIPSARGGHSAVSLKNQLFLFGGEETATKKVLGELYVFDIHSQTWTQPSTTGTAPYARSAHSAASIDDRYMVIFGGGSVSHCFNDIFVLDTETMEWFNPEIVGNFAAPRAGHASVLLGKQWYIIGGGNNLQACTDAIVISLSTLNEKNVKTTLLGKLQPDTELSSEGTSFVNINGAKAFGFGGYNGKYLDRICLLSGSEEKKLNAPIPAAHQVKAVPAPASPATKKTDNIIEQLQEKLKVESKKCMHLEVENAELKQKLLEMEDLQKTLDAYKKREEAENGNSNGLWGYISGA